MKRSGTEIVKQILFFQMKDVTEQDFSQIQSVAGHSFSKLFKGLVNDVGVNQKMLPTLLKQITTYLQNNSENQLFLSDSFCRLWTKIEFCSMSGNDKKKDYTKILDLDAEDQITEENLIPSIKEYFQVLGIKGGEDEVGQLKSQMMSKSYLKIYLQQKRKKYEQDTTKNQNKNTLEIEEDLTEMLSKLKDSLQQCKQSKLDRIIYENLLDSYQSRINKKLRDNKGEIYSDKKYEQFKQNLISILQEYSIFNKKIKNVLDTPINEKEGQDYYSKIYSIRGQIHSVYIPEFLYLVEKNKHTKDLVKDKNVIVTLGVSGAGKSTLVQLILGYEMKILQKEGQLTTLVTTRELRPQHKQFVAKASTKSVTSYCSAIQLQNIKDQQESAEMYLVDTPGFFDSGGIAVQSSNAISTLRVLAAAASLRIVFIINEKNFGTRGEGLKKLAKVISMLFTKYDKQKPIFFLNRFDQKSLKQLPILIKTMKEQLNETEQSDNKFLQVINHFEEIVSKAQNLANEKKKNIAECLKKSRQVVIMNPFQPDLEEIESKLSQSTRAFKKPRQILANVIPQEVRIGLCAESALLQSIIQGCLKNRTKQNTETLIYTMKQLTKFASETEESNDVGNAGKILQSIKSNLILTTSNLYNEMEQCLEKKVLSLRVDKTTIKECNKTQENLLKLQQIMIKIPGIPETNYRHKINVLIKKVSQKLRELSAQKLSKDLVQTISVFCEINPTLWKQLISDVEIKIKSLKQKNQKEIKAQNFTNIQQNVKELETIKELFSDFPNISIQIDEWKKVLKETVQNRHQNVISLVNEKIKQVQNNQKILTPSQLKRMAQAIKIFSVIDNNQRQQLRQITQIFRSLRNKILQLARKYIHEIRKVVNSGDDLVNKSETFISIASNSIKNANLIIENIKEIESEVKSDLKMELSFLAEFIRGKKAFIDCLLQKSQNDKNSWSQTKPIYTNIKILHKLSELIDQEQQRKKCLQTINMCKEKLEHRLGSQKQSLSDKIISLQTPQAAIKNILEVYKICNSICTEQEQKNVQLSFKNISTICQQIKNMISGIIKEVLGEIDKIAKDLKQMLDNNNNSPIKQKQKKENQNKEGQGKKENIRNIENINLYHSRIIRSKIFFQVVKYTNFKPQELKNRIKQSSKEFNIQFCKAFDYLIKQINNQIKQIIQQIEKKKNVFLQIKRDTAYKMKRMIVSFYKFSKSNEIKSIITQIDNLEIRERQIKDNINELKHILQKQYDQHFNDKKYSDCKAVTQSCENLKCLDEFNVENQYKFQSMAKDMRQKNDSKRSEKEMNIRDFIGQEVDISILKKVYNYLKQFHKGSRENERYLQIIEALRQHFDKRQKGIARQIKNNARDNNLNISNNMSEIAQKIDSMDKQLKQINDIFKQQGPIITQNRETKKLISKQVEKIIINSVSKINKHLERLEFNQTEQLCSIIEQLEKYMLEDAQKDTIKNLKEQMKIQQNQFIYSHYDNLIYKKKKQRYQRYLGTRIQVGENFNEQYYSFSAIEQQKIASNLQKQIKKQLDSIKIKSFQNSEFVQIEVNKISSKYQNLSPKLLEPIQKIIEDKKKSIQSEQQKITKNINKNWKLQTAYQSFEQAKGKKEYFCSSIIFKLSETEYDKIITNIVQQYKSGSNRDLISLIKTSFSQPVSKIKFKEDEYKKMVERKQQAIATHLNRVTEKQMKNLNAIIEKKHDLTELEQQSNQSALNLENIVNVLTLVSETKNNMFNIFKFQEFKNQLKSALDFHYNKIKQFSDEVNIENLVKNQQDYLVYNNNSKLFDLFLDKIKQGPLQLKKYLDQYKPIVNNVERNRTKIKNEIKQLEKRMINKRIIKEEVKSKSSDEREKHFEGLIKDIDCLSKLTVFLEKKEEEKVKESIDKKKLQIKNDLLEGQRISTDSLQKGFQTYSAQFDKTINLMLDLGKISSYNQFNQKKDQLIEKIREKNTQVFQNIKKFSKNIRKIKQTFRKNQKQIEKKYQNLKISKIQAEKQKLQKKRENNLRQINKLDKDDKENQQKIRQYYNQINQWQRQKDENVKNFTVENNKNQDKEYQDLNKKFSGDMISYSQSIIIAYKSTQLISLDRKYWKQMLQKQLSDDEKAFGKRIISMIYKYLLNECKCIYSSMLVDSYGIFKSNQALQWQAKVKGRGIEYVLKNIKIDSKLINQLKTMFDNYDQQFRSWTERYQKNPSHIVINQLLNQIKTLSSKMQKFYHQSSSDSSYNPVKLLALIFALWVIMGSSYDEQDMIVEFTYQPHPAQVVGIFLSLSLYKKQRSIKSVMTEILTGQGKSIVLGGMSAYLALCGFQVYCVCYSSYLTGRDYNAFKQFFQKLQINKSIVYGTFEATCQSLLNTKNGRKGLREIMHQILTSKKQGFFSKFASFIKQSFFSKALAKSDDTVDRKIMLIDEVDVFFDPTLFGNLYLPDITLQSEKIKSLIKEVWKYFGQCRNNKTFMKKQYIMKKKQFNQVTKQFQRLDKILEEQIKAMILGCRGVEHDYIIKNDLIQYKNQDTITSKIHYGFQTVFAYLKQWERNNITTTNAEKQLKISLIVGQFSYALLPTFFKSIIGVTGTYQILPQFKKNLMKNQYKVNQTYFIPSVYGNTNQRKIYEPIILKTEQFWNKVIEEIIKVHETGRPVLVFFRDNNQLSRFYSSPGYQKLQKQTTFLNETHDAYDRDSRIKGTCGKGKITFMTRSFGRGTDFIIYSHDEQILKIGHGGLHVIQTFISVGKSEEVQIMGRTARQGDPGTYQLIIPQQDLQLLQLQLIKLKNPIQDIEKARKKMQDKQKNLILKKLNESNQKHKQCLALYSKENVKLDQIVQYIHKLNSFPQLTQKICKTTILVDATGSMSGILRNLLNVLGEVVRNVIQITKENKKISSSQLQICIYRNYNSPYEALFQSTPFESQSTNLQSFLNIVTAQGGWGNEALQIGLNHVNNTPEISQVIIIADARGNTKQQVIKRRKTYGEDYWIEKKVPILSVEQQMQKIKQKKIEIHSFYVSSHQAVQNYFKNLSRMTGGTAQKFDPDGKQAASILSNFIAERILTKASPDDMKQQILNSYRRMRNSK